MTHRININEDTYIKYETTERSRIIIPTVSVIHNEKIISELENDYYKGILACLIESRINNKERCTAEDIYDYAWPIGENDNLEHNVADRLSKIRGIFKKIIGAEATKNLLPRKGGKGDYRICFSNNSLELNKSESMANDCSVSFHDIFDLRRLGLKDDNVAKQLARNDEELYDVIENSVSFHDIFSLRRLGLKDDDIAKQLVRNDEKLYDVIEGSREEGTYKKWLQAFREDPEAWGFLINNNKEIVGNYSMTILSPEQKCDLLSGNLYEGLISLKDTYSFRPGTDYCLYILNISVNYEYNTRENRDLLYNKMFSCILDMAKKGVFFSSAYTTTSIFLKEFKSYGFKEILERDNKFTVLGLEHFPQDLRWNQKNELLELYNNNFNLYSN